MKEQETNPDELGATPNWIVENPWVNRWLGCRGASASVPDGMQIFRTSGGCSVGMKKDLTEAWCEDLLLAHKQVLIKTLVFGTFRLDLTHDWPIRSLSGFLEQKGRLPTENDEIEIISYEDRYLLYRERLERAGRWNEATMHFHRQPEFDMRKAEVLSEVRLVIK